MHMDNLFTQKSLGYSFSAQNNTENLMVSVATLHTAATDSKGYQQIKNQLILHNTF